MTGALLEREGSEFVQYDDFAVEYRDSSHRYWIIKDGARSTAISVTSALKVLDKPALVSWAERCGVEGALELERNGQLNGVAIHDATKAMRAQGFGASAKRDTGADRGTAIHDALRLYCSESVIPKVGDFDPSVRGYVSALCKWLIAASPEPLLVEQIVASPEHGFAGRVDLVATVGGFRTLVDLKTSPDARVYTEAHLQAAAYGLALEHCGQEPVTCATIVAAGADGSYRAVPLCAEPEQFLTVLACHRAMRAVRAAEAA